MSFKNLILQDFDQEQVSPQIYKLKVNPTGWDYDLNQDVL